MEFYGGRAVDVISGASSQRGAIIERELVHRFDSIVEATKQAEALRLQLIETAGFADVIRH